MATREENIKKINAELEKLGDDELEKIAGGNAEKTSNDGRFLNDLNGTKCSYGPKHLPIGR